MEILLNIKEGIIATSWLEWLAVIFSLSYVFLAAKKNILCWVAALFSTGIYIYLCYSSQLYIESALQVFYFAMAIYGFVIWKNSTEKEILIIKWKPSIHLINVVLSGVAALVLGYLFDTYTDQQSAYLDAFTTCYSFAATFMVAKKVLENWIYWIIIDFASIFLYANRGMSLTAVLMIIYTLFAVYGYFEWRKKLRSQNLIISN
jgi:nicotinamide mononucleotide transporter